VIAPAATNVVVKGFHALPGVGLVFPTDWVAMATPSLNAPNIAANNSVGVIVGPFKWMPSQVGHECMIFSVSAKGDAGNIDGHVVGPIPEWRLVPHDNNIGQRNVHPVNNKLDLVLWEKLPFWIRNRGRDPVRLGVEIKLPKWLEQFGWNSARPRPGAAGPAPHGASGRGLGTHSMAPRAMSRVTILSASPSSSTSSPGLPRPRAVDTYRPWPGLVPAIHAFDRTSAKLL